MPSAHPIVAALLALTAAGVAAGCGGGSAKSGGTLTVVNQGDFQEIDPGASYYQFDYMIDYATQRPLYSFKPSETRETPDLAAAPAHISPDNRTVTVRIRRHVRFSPPVNREVTSRDVKYAIERAFSAGVPNAYVSAYMPLVGAPDKPTAHVQPIRGITTPDRYTIRFRLTKPTGSFFAQSLALPASAPVPPEYAGRFDDQNPSTYGTHQVATGPYMIRNDRRGTLTGYAPDRQITLVRNPNWARATDYRPAYLNRIVVQEGNTDAAAATREVFTGSDMITGDVTPPGASLRDATTIYKKQLATPYSGGWRWVALNTKQKPFDDIDVRKAVIAGLDKTALRQARGGPTIGTLAYHFIPPEFPGYEQSGGSSSPYDFMASATANPAVMAKYFRAAGFASGKYTGPNRNVTLTCDAADPGKSVCAVVADELRGMGFNPSIQSLPREKTVSVYGIPSKEPAVLPDASWIKDFYDPQTLLDNAFDGRAILPENNSNYAQLNDPAINAMFARAAVLRDFQARVDAYAAINKAVVAQAVGVPFVWDRQPTAESRDVKGVINKFNSIWDLSFTSLR
jgi:peptide/nickel transport system substrate-binding protein